LRDGQRVDDAIRAAGGATEDADLTHLNLAQRLRDEGYILVPDKSAAATTPSSSSQPGALCNINTATLAQLDALPGIGATYAKRILDYRTSNGPFQKTSDLVTLKLVPQSTFDKVKDLIDVK
jgi:competence protein ComEA